MRLTKLELQGFINSLREAPKSRGYPPATLTINPEGGFAIGVHITPKSVEAALINLAGDIVGMRRRDLVKPNPDFAFARIGELVGEIRALKSRGRHLQ